jgi:hypothetical protein
MEKAPTLAAALGTGVATFVWKGKTLRLEEWDLLDVSDLESEVGSIEEFNPLSSDGQKIALWLTLRKNDDRLTTDDMAEGRYQLTLAQAARQIKASDLKTPEYAKLISAIVGSCGLFGGEGDSKNAEAGEETSD